MTETSVLCGSRDAFAIECHLDGITDTPARNLVGRVWFWMGGRQIGNADVVSLPGIIANELQQTLKDCGERNDERLYTAEIPDVVRAIRDGLYGSSGEDSQHFKKFLICMLPGGHEYLDGWLTVMIEGMTSNEFKGDRMVYHNTHAGITGEVWLPVGSYGDVVRSFLSWFEWVSQPG